MSRSKSNPKKKSFVSEQTKVKPSRIQLESFLNSKYTGLIISGFYLIVVGFVSFTFHTVGDYGIETDFFWGYVPSAKKFLSGEIPMDAFRGPLYPIFLGIVGFINGDFFAAGILIAVISSSIVVYVTYELLKHLFSPIVSLFVTILLTVNLVFIQYSYSAGTDMFFNALAALTLFFFFKNNELNYKNLIIAAVFGGLSYLTRYNGIFLASFILIILFVNYWKITWTERIKASIIFLIVFLVTFSPWGIHCLNEKGSFFYNENYKNIAYEVYGKGKVSWDDFWFNESSKINSLNEVIFKDFELFFTTIIKNVGNHFVEDMGKLVGWQIGVFVILGLFLFLFSKPFKDWKQPQTGYYLVNISFFALLLLVFYSERFSLFLIPFYLVIAISPFFIEKFRISKSVPKSFKYILMIGLIVFTFIKSYSFNSENINSGPTELLTLRDWYQENIPDQLKGKTVAARKAHVAYYLDMDFKLMPMANTYEEFIKKLKADNVDYLYFGIAEAGLRSELQFLIDPKSKHPGLEVVVYFNNPPSVLYRVVK